MTLAGIKNFQDEIIHLLPPPLHILFKVNHFHGTISDPFWFLLIALLFSFFITFGSFIAF